MLDFAPKRMSPKPLPAVVDQVVHRLPPLGARAADRRRCAAERQVAEELDAVGGAVAEGDAEVRDSVKASWSQLMRAPWLGLPFGQRLPGRHEPQPVSPMVVLLAGRVA